MFVRIEAFGHYWEIGKITSEPGPPHTEYVPPPMVVDAPPYVGFVHTDPDRSWAGRAAGDAREEDL